MRLSGINKGDELTVTTDEVFPMYRDRLRSWNLLSKAVEYEMQ